MDHKVLSFNDAMQRRAEKLKKSAVCTAQKAGNVIKIVQEKTLGENEDIKDVSQVITQDVRNSAGHIVSAFDNL
jgi:hypothetical protein